MTHELTPEFAALVMMNAFKQDLSRLITSVLKAMEDGSIGGWEGFQLAQQATALGANTYDMVKTLPPEVAEAIPAALLKMQLSWPEPKAPSFEWPS